jgi:predicted Zn-dependent protease
MARQDFPAARRLLQQAMEQYPQSLWPLILLSQTLLQQGQDLDAAERVMVDILARDPTQGHIQQQLNWLRRQRARSMKS